MSNNKSTVDDKEQEQKSFLNPQPEIAEDWYLLFKPSHEDEVQTSHDPNPEEIEDVDEKSNHRIPKKYHELVTLIINEYFSLTGIKITPDDPIIGMLAIGRIGLEDETKLRTEELARIQREIDSTKIMFAQGQVELAKQINNQNDHLSKNLSEVDRRFATAEKLSKQFELTRKDLMDELAILHQKNLYNFGSDIKTKVTESYETTSSLSKLIKRLTVISIINAGSSLLTLLILLKLIGGN